VILPPTPCARAGLTPRGSSEEMSARSPRPDGDSACGDECPSYSMPWCVEKTFISCPIGKPLLMERFLTERCVRSAPPTRPQTPRPGGDEQAVGCPAAAAGTCRPEESTGSRRRTHVKPLTLGEAPTARSGAVRSSGALDPASLRAQSMGSLGHSLRKCKPCAFLYSAEGCNNGALCEFCHLCDVGELKRRRQERKQRQRHHVRGQEGGRQRKRASRKPKDDGHDIV